MVLINPTDDQRHEILKNLLIKDGRLVDFENIINLLKPPPDITEYILPGKLKGVKIGIIGGGLSGLSSAFELRKTGADITIFDALDDRIGGRVYTHYFDEDKKYYGELGPIRIPISHETTWHYINKFKLNTIPFIQFNPNAFIYVNNIRVRNNDYNIKTYLYPKYNLTEAEKSLSWTDLYTYAINYPLKTLPPEIRTEIFKILPSYSPQYNQLIQFNLRQIFERLGLSNDAINLITSIDSLTGSFLYSDYSEMLQEIYALDYNVLYQIVGGMTNLPLALYKSLMSKEPVEYGNLPISVLGNVEYKSGHIINGIYRNYINNKVLLKYQMNNNFEDYYSEFDYVICTIPFSTLREVDIKPTFSNPKMQAIREVNYIDSFRSVFLCNNRFWEEKTGYGNIIGGGISYTDLPIQSIIYPSYNKENDDLGVLIACYNFGQDSTRLGNIETKRRFEVVK
ncbi:MAG: amine oxidase, partial [Haloplasmataceae bacterium]|nr:amine oxidase [Haloplasmataceae bacterium]